MCLGRDRPRIEFRVTTGFGNAAALPEGRESRAERTVNFQHNNDGWRTLLLLVASVMTIASLWTLRTYHFLSALILGLFLVLHVINHVVGLMGQDQHVAFMDAVRPLYRNAFVEPTLLALFASQIMSGLTMVVRNWQSRRGAIAWLQAGTGLYLAAFVILHVLAVLSGRIALGLDTDFRFAAAGFHVSNWPWYFWPYYSSALFSLFAHVGCAIYWKTLQRGGHLAQRTLVGMMTIGVVLGLLTSAMLAGLLYPVEIPASYKATYGGA